MVKKLDAITIYEIVKSGNSGARLGLGRLYRAGESVRVLFLGTRRSWVASCVRCRRRF